MYTPFVFHFVLISLKKHVFVSLQSCSLYLSYDFTINIMGGRREVYLMALIEIGCHGKCTSPSHHRC